MFVIGQFSKNEMLEELVTRITKLGLSDDELIEVICSLANSTGHYIAFNLLGHDDKGNITDNYSVCNCGIDPYGNVSSYVNYQYGVVEDEGEDEKDDGEGEEVEEISHTRCENCDLKNCAAKKEFKKPTINDINKCVDGVFKDLEQPLKDLADLENATLAELFRNEKLKAQRNQKKGPIKKMATKVANKIGKDKAKVSNLEAALARENELDKEAIKTAADSIRFIFNNKLDKQVGQESQGEQEAQVTQQNINAWCDSPTESGKYIVQNIFGDGIVLSTSVETFKVKGEITYIRRPDIMIGDTFIPYNCTAKIGKMRYLKIPNTACNTQSFYRGGIRVTE